MEHVKVRREKIAIKTYPVGEPEKNPMFFEKRVYQGSCGKVYPVPFIDKVYDTPSMKKYDAVTLENEYVRLVLLPASTAPRTKRTATTTFSTATT